MLLVMNKYDLVEELVESGHDIVEHMTPEYMQKFADDYGFMGAMATSAKTGQGVTEAVAILCKEILKREFNRNDENAIADEIYKHGAKLTNEE